MIFEKKLNIYNREMIDKILNQNSMLEIILVILIVGILVLFGIGLFRKKKFKGYLKIFNLFEGGFESED